MSVEENKELVHRFADERMNNGNLDIHDEMLAPSLDTEEWKAWIRYLGAAFRNIRYTILDIIAEDDKVVLHWRFSAMHQGDFLGVAATGKQVTVQGLALFRVMDGKIAADDSYWDNLFILEQLGVAPARY
jgi:steroid delta-isomerase-like uncharacterized protein